MFTAKCVPDEKDWIPAFAGIISAHPKLDLGSRA